MIRKDDLTELEKEVKNDDSDHMNTDERYRKALLRNKAIDEINQLGIVKRVYEPTRNTFIVDDTFYFFPVTKKWRKVGKSKCYQSKGFKDFFTRFVEN